MKFFEWNYNDYSQYASGNPKINGFSRYINDKLIIYNNLINNYNTNLLINSDYNIIDKKLINLIETYTFTTFKDNKTLGIINFSVSYTQIIDVIDPTKTTTKKIEFNIAYSTGIYKKYSKMIGVIDFNNETGNRTFSLSCCFS